jgi:hypothetical protein
MRTLSILAVGLFLLAPVAHAETVAGVTWKPPVGWKAEPARPMRVATYTIAPIKGDARGAELSIFFFGTGQGGTIDENIKRWASQFQPTHPATTKKETVGGIAVTRVETQGEYSGGMGPNLSGDPAAAPHPPVHVLLGAIVEAPEGLVFFKLVGLPKTVASARPAFDKMLKTLTK